MSLSHNELLYLMAYVDGQVDDDELPEVTALLARSEEAREIVRQHEAMGDWVRATSEARAEAAGADAIAGRVAADIDKLGGGKVIELERERAKVALQRQRVKEFSALVAVAAVAAAFWFMPAVTQPLAVKSPPKPQPTSTARKTPLASAPSAVALAPSASADAPDGPDKATASTDEAMDVQSVESPAHPFSIFYVPAATGLNAHSSSVVVWIGE